ncbi:site-specific integrase [Pedobacter sp. Leaf170]|uniref:tyrosine-type recombinase/integrase n=1 Tax=Pedobacter sp. Leaf170 TaxID=2876558 RepID=UPI001E2B8F5D|nr:site-specific integrase [Pedobacter sp. Leaf170]
MKTKWEGPFLYEPAGGDMTKDWFVWIKYQHPVTGKYIRFRYNTGFNKLKTKQERRDYGKDFVQAITDLLKDGFTPFAEYNVMQNLLDKQKTVSLCIDKFLSELNVRPNTYHKYSLELNLFKNYLKEHGYGDVLLRDIRKGVVVEFLTHYKEKRNWKGKTYNHYLTDITTFFNYFYNNYDDYLEKVPTLKLKRAPIEKPGNSAFNDYQFKKLKELMLANDDKLLFTFCSFIYYAALRNVSEANFIKVGDFNFKQKTLKIESGTAKNRKTEYIPLYPDFLELLYELKIPEMPPEWFVFARNRMGAFLGGEKRVGLDYFSRLFKPYKKILKLSERDGIYCYKHTRAVHLGEDGEELYKIMKLFRHSNLNMTMIYMRDLGINVDKTEFNKGRQF